MRSASVATVLAYSRPSTRPINANCPAKGHFGYVWCVTFSTDGRFLVICGSGSKGFDSEFLIWDANTGECVRSLVDDDGSGPILSIALTTSWPALVVQQEIRIASNYREKYCSRISILPENCCCRLLCVLGYTMASASGDHAIKIWNISAA